MFSIWTVPTEEFEFNWIQFTDEEDVEYAWEFIIIED